MQKILVVRWYVVEKKSTVNANGTKIQRTNSLAGKKSHLPRIMPTRRIGTDKAVIRTIKRNHATKELEWQPKKIDLSSNLVGFEPAG